MLRDFAHIPIGDKPKQKSFYILVAPSLRFYGLMKSSLVLASLALIAGFVFANEKLSDSTIKKKLLGYWGNPRHSYLIKSDGVMSHVPARYFDDNESLGCERRKVLS